MSPTQDLEYRGFYINLARNTERKACLLENLKRAGVDHKYARFDAVDGRAVAEDHPTTLDPGNLGCYLSHLAILQSQRDANCDVHVLEDDAIVSKDFAVSFASLRSLLEPQRETWDVVFTEVFVPVDLSTYQLYASKLRLFEESRVLTLVPLRNIDFCCTSSMLINRLSIGEYADLMSGGWKLGHPIDIYFRQLVRLGQLKAFVTMPFLTSVSDLSSQSDIRGKVDRSRAVLDVLRHAFFVDAHHSDCLRRLRALTEGSKNTALDAVYLQTLQFALSDTYEAF